MSARYGNDQPNRNKTQMQERGGNEMNHCDHGMPSKNRGITEFTQQRPRSCATITQCIRAMFLVYRNVYGLCNLCTYRNTPHTTAAAATDICASEKSMASGSKQAAVRRVLLVSERFFSRKNGGCHVLFGVCGKYCSISQLHRKEFIIWVPCRLIVG